MKKTFIALLIAAVAASASTAPIAQGSNPVICLAYDTGGPGDGSFNDAAQAGLKVAAKKLQFSLETTVTSGDAKDRIDRLTALVKKNCSIVIAVGTGYAATLKELSREFPETRFAILNDATVDALNVTSIVFADLQGAYLAGYAAALASKSGKVGMVGYTSQKDLFEKGFSPGAKAAKKSIITTIRYNYFISCFFKKKCKADAKSSCTNKSYFHFNFAVISKCQPRFFSRVSNISVGIASNQGCLMYLPFL